MYGVSRDAIWRSPTSCAKDIRRRGSSRFPTRLSPREEEAEAVLPELRRRNIHSFLLVTSDYHTARAGRIYRHLERRVPAAPAMRVVAAPDEFFRADSWWRSRQGQKIAFTEWCKTFATALGI